MSPPYEQTFKWPIVIWFFLCTLAVFGMIVLGGVTRLTGAGLSIVEWEPIRGIFPPLNQMEWDHVFSKYQEHSEFLRVNTWMTLDDFKSIFWLEYLHRLWGRLIGIIVIVPLIFFTVKRALTRTQFTAVLGLFFLGGLQGLIGWYMVKSGLGSDPHVSPYKLTLHLLMASGLILGFLTLGIQSIYLPVRMLSRSMQLQSFHKNPYFWLLFLCFLTLSYGGLVAGHKAGLIYNTFPKMGDSWLPSEMWDMQPFVLNMIANPAAVQAIHRILALGFMLFAFGVIGWRYCFKREEFCKWEIALVIMVCIQITLGVMTLLHHVPVFLATLHQACGIIVLSLTYVSLFVSRRKFKF